MWYLALVGFVCVGLVAALFAARAQGVWGSRRSTKTVVAGAGPYRAQETAGVEPVPVPHAVWITATLSAVWGALTTFVFAPAGALLLIIFIDGGLDLGRTIAGLANLAIVVSGVALGVASMAAAFGLMRRSEHIARLTRVLSCWSLVHHSAVPIFFAAITIAAGETSLFVWNLPFVWVPCAFGFWHALRLDSAYAWTADPVPEPA